MKSLKRLLQDWLEISTIIDAETHRRAVKMDEILNSGLLLDRASVENAEWKITPKMEDSDGITKGYKA